MDNALRVSKRTGTHADVLYAAGAADLLRDAYPIEEIQIKDFGDAFVVECPGPVLEAIRERLRPDPGYRYICEKGSEAPSGMNVCFAEQERQQAQRYYEQNDALRKAGKAFAEIQQLLAEQQPSPWWRREQSVLQLQGHDAANKLARQVFELEPSVLRTVVSAGVEALVRGSSSGVAWKADQVQVFNPPAAKGYARLKPDSTNRGDGTGDAWADPLVEWLRIRGYHSLAAPFTGPKGAWIRIIVPIPSGISLNTLRELSAELPRSGVRTTSEVKLDSMAVLALARLLVERCEENQQPGAKKLPGLKLRNLRPSSVIGGIHVAHYQKASKFAYALGSLHQVAVPGWFAIEGPKDVQEWLAILDEHRAALRSLDERHSDEIGLLVAYRRFLQSPEEEGSESVAEAFLDFLAQYGCFLVRVRAREVKRPVRQFVTENVRRVLMGITNSYTAILNDPGFESIASAVRRVTVGAQALKSLKAQGKLKQGVEPGEIRYDLLPDLRRKLALTDDEFMEAVSLFVSQYNSGNSRRREMGRQAPRNVTTEEFLAFASLVEQHHAAKVGALLCAYGTCRAPRDADDTAGTADDATGPDTDTEAEVV